MRAGLISTVAAAAVLLCSCGPKTLTLPDDPIDRAATCGSVAAASERAATADIKAPLSFDAVGHVIHYPLLAGASGGTFSSAAAAAVQKRMAAIQDKVVESNWRALVPGCKGAFPATAVDAPKLPADRFEAELGCDELSSFLRTALENQAPYEAALRDYGKLNRKLEGTLAVGLRSRVGADVKAQQAERRKALATIAGAGSPIAVMRQCIATYG